jgi:hypothetical protein
MTLEGKIVFASRNDAAEFQKYLRGNGCPSRISIENVICEESRFEGTISAFLAFIRKMKAEHADEDMIQLENHLLENEAVYEEFFKTFGVGDLVTHTDIERVISQVQAAGKMYREYGEIGPMLLIMALRRNDILEKAEGAGDQETIPPTCKLVRTLEPGDMRVTYPITMLPALNPDNIRETGLTTRVSIYADTGFAVTTGPDIVIRVNADDVSSILDTLDTDPDDVDVFCNKLLLKQALFLDIHELISGGISSEEALYTALSAKSFWDEDNSATVRYSVSREFIAGVVSDLRKLDVIKGKDGKLKIA